MTQPDVIEVPIAEYQDLVKRVERLEMLVGDKLADKPAEADTTSPGYSRLY